MKRFVLSSLMTLFCVFASAQYIQGVTYTDEKTNAIPVLSYSKGKLYSDGSVLSDEEVRGMIGQDLYDATYYGARRQYKAGNVLIAVGGGIFGCGLGMVIGAAVVWDDELLLSGYLIGSLGESVLGAGIILYCVGKGRLQWVAEEYNRNRRHENKVSLAFGTTKNGIGLSLTF